MCIDYFASGSFVMCDSRQWSFPSVRYPFFGRLYLCEVAFGAPVSTLIGSPFFLSFHPLARSSRQPSVGHPQDRVLAIPGGTPAVTSISGFGGAPFPPPTTKLMAPEPAPPYARRASLFRQVDSAQERRLTLTWSRWFGQLEGLVKVYSDCEITPSSSSAPALTGGCHGWHEAGSYPVIDDDDDALWNCGNLAAGAQAWAAVLARESSNGLWAPASPPSGFSATVSGRPQAGQVHSAGWDMVLGPLMR